MMGTFRACSTSSFERLTWTSANPNSPSTCRTLGAAGTPLKAALSGLTLETTREDLLLSLVRGNATYLGENLKEVTALVRVGRRVGISGGGSGVRGMLEARRRWTGEYEYVFQDQSSLLGAAILGQMSQLGRLPGSGQVTAGDI